jgi:TolB-like protein/Flp pilus assembly protein TadD
MKQGCFNALNPHKGGGAAKGNNTPCTSLKIKVILEQMPLSESDAQAASEELERVLASPGFARNERLSKFLRYIVECHLDDRDGELKESLIGIHVFGRAPGYDSKKDPIVRTEATRLRARLSEYYVGEGKANPVVIELPRGGYIPVLLRSQIDLNKPVTRRFENRWMLSAGIVAVLAIATLVLGWWRLHSTQPLTIAVLPLDNLSHDPANDFFSDGLTDELIRNLSLIEGLAPRSRTSSFAFKNKPRNVHEVASELHADYILEGSVLRAGQRLRIDAQLIRARDDFPVWSNRYDRELTDVFAIQDEIARGIVNSLRLKLGRGRRRYQTSVDAYDAYLRAQALVTGEGLPAYQRSINLYEEAIEKDPTFALAWAGEADVYVYLSGTFPQVNEQKGQLEKMRNAADRSIQLDPLSPEANDASASVYARDGEWRESERSFRRAIELNPNSSTTRLHFAMYLLMVLGRTDEAVRELRIAERSDPRSADLQYSLAFGLMLEGRYGEAASHCAKLPDGNRTKPECMGRALLAQGRTAEAIQVMAQLCCRGNRGYLGYAYARAGDTGEARKLLGKLAPNPFNEALVYAGLGDKQRTIEALERMAILGPVRVGRELGFPEFAFVRDDPRISALRKRVGLPD